MVKEPWEKKYRSKKDEGDMGLMFVAGFIHWYLMRTGVGPVIWIYLFFQYGWDNVKIGFAIFFILWVLYVSNLIGNSKNQNKKAKKEVDGCLFIIFGFSILFLLFYFLQ